MSNDPKADLIYAILSMDSYNRDYGARLRLRDYGRFAITVPVY